MSIKLKISLSVKFIIQPSFFHPFISKLSSTIEFSNSSTLVHHTTSPSVRRGLLYGEKNLLICKAATACKTNVTSPLTETKLLRFIAKLTQLVQS